MLFVIALIDIIVAFISMADQLTDEQIDEFREAFQLFSGGGITCARKPAAGLIGSAAHQSPVAVPLRRCEITCDILDAYARLDVTLEFAPCELDSFDSNTNPRGSG